MSTPQRLLALAVLVTLLVPIAPALPGVESLPACTPTRSGAGACAFVSGPASGSYVYDVIVVPADAVVRYSGTILLRANVAIVVDGSILPDGAHGGSVYMRAPQVTIAGRVRAADGAEAPAHNGTGTAYFGTDGGNGGRIQIETEAFGLGATGEILGGNGGAGQDVTLEAAPGGTAIAVGGSGGDGGAVYVFNGQLLARIHFGNAGHGGRAIALAPPGAELVAAIGGNGGSATRDAIALALLLAGRASGGAAGDGGAATAISGAWTWDADGPIADTRARACAGAPGAPGADGARGCDAGDAYARAGTGGDGLFGGHGGVARAYAANAGDGGRGGDATSASPAGDGGDGGDGGDARAVGGDGGNAGNGGYAFARAGSAGHGRDGGNGLRIANGDGTFLCQRAGAGGAGGVAGRGEASGGSGVSGGSATAHGGVGGISGGAGLTPSGCPAG